MPGKFSGTYLPFRNELKDASRSEAPSPTGTNPTTVAVIPDRFVVLMTSWTTGMPTPPMRTAAIMVPMLSWISPILFLCTSCLDVRFGHYINVLDSYCLLDSKCLNCLCRLEFALLLDTMGLIKDGLGVTIAAVLVTGAAIPVVNASLVTQLQSVTNETVDSTGSVPETFTTNELGYGLVKDSETVEVYDSFDDTTYTLAESDYKVNYETGEFNVTNGDLDADGDVEINSTSDQYRYDYEYKPNGYVGGLNKVILPFVVVALAVGLLMAAFRPIMKM